MKWHPLLQAEMHFFRHSLNEAIIFFFKTNIHVLVLIIELCFEFIYMYFLDWNPPYTQLFS